MRYYTKPNQTELLKAWGSMGWEQRNRERTLGEIPDGADPEVEEDHLGLDDEQWAQREDFEKNCSCHIHPPCSNCIEYSELHPETW